MNPDIDFLSTAVGTPEQGADEEPWTVFDVLYAWSNRVSQLCRYSAGLPEYTGLNWGPDDYTALLWARQNVSDAAQFLAHRRGELDEHPFLQATDDLFRNITIADPGEVVKSWVGHPLPNDSWWWKRIPSMGPIHDEMLS